MAHYTLYLSSEVTHILAKHNCPNNVFRLVWQYAPNTVRPEIVDLKYLINEDILRRILFKDLQACFASRSLRRDHWRFLPRPNFDRETAMMEHIETRAVEVEAAAVARALALGAGTSLVVASWPSMPLLWPRSRSDERLRETLKLLHQKLGSYENIVKFIKNLDDNPSLRQRMYRLPIEERMLKIGHFVKIRAKLRLYGIL